MLKQLKKLVPLGAIMLVLVGALSVSTASARGFDTFMDVFARR